MLSDSELLLITAIVFGLFPEQSREILDYYAERFSDIQSFSLPTPAKGGEKVCGNGLYLSSLGNPPEKNETTPRR